QRLHHDANREAGEQVAPVWRRGDLEGVPPGPRDEEADPGQGDDPHDDRELPAPHHVHGIGNSPPQRQPLDGGDGRTHGQASRPHGSGHTTCPYRATGIQGITRVTMPSVTELGQLTARRAFECRLTPDLALGALEGAAAFLAAVCLPPPPAAFGLRSVFESCHEAPYAPGKPGFGQWPRTK